MTTRIPSEEDFPAGLQWLGRLVIDAIVFRNRCRSVADERARLPTVRSTIETFREQLANARANGLVHVERVFNVGLYVLLIDRDFGAVKVEMVSTFEPWRLRYTARHTALLLYECCDDLTQMLGKSFRESVVELAVPADAQEELNRISSTLHRFKGEHRAFLYSEVRNLQTAHRDQDSLALLAAIETLDPMRIFTLAAGFWQETLSPLIALLTRITAHLSAPGVMLRQLVASEVFVAGALAQVRVELDKSGSASIEPAAT